MASLCQSMAADVIAVIQSLLCIAPSQGIYISLSFSCCSNTKIQFHCTSKEDT
jgi:hypothetical protein